MRVAFRGCVDEVDSEFLPRRAEEDLVDVDVVGLAHGKSDGARTNRPGSPARIIRPSRRF